MRDLPQSSSDVSPPPNSAEVRERLSHVVEALPDGLLCLDASWHITYANAEARRISRLDGRLPSQKTHWELFPETVGTELERCYRSAMTTRQASRIEYTYQPFGLTLDIGIVPTDEGIALHYRDLTAQRWAERREKEHSERLNQVFEATSDAIAVLDRDWRYTYLNSKAQLLIDPEHRLVGKNIWEEFPMTVGGPAWETYHRSMNERVSGQAEMYYPAPLNAWLSVHSHPTSEGIVVFFRDITEQKNHRAILQGQNELLATVQQAARLATWELDPVTEVITWGQGSCELFGRPMEELATLRDLSSLLDPGGVDIRSQIDEAMRTGDAFLAEFAMTTRDSLRLWVEARGQAVTGLDGGRRLRGMALDSTARKANEELLIASESRYRVLADLNPQAIWMGNAAGEVTYANQGFLTYIGLTPESLAGAGWLQAFAPSDRERVTQVWTRSVVTGVDYKIEALMRNAALGDYRYWELRAAPVRDASGDILHWLGVASDIHDAKVYAATLRAEQAETERRRAELESIYKATPVGLALLDPMEFRFLNLNDHEAETLGYPKHEILGREVSEIIPIPDLVGLLRTAAAGIAVKEHLLEGELPSRPGERRAWSVSYSPVFNEDGSVRAISTATLEITKQKKAESALIQSEKLAAVGRLASSISHEINNPLEAITNLLFLIAMDAQLPQELKAYVHMAQSELSRVSQIATQTLRFHRQSVAPTPVTAEELAGAVVRLYAGRLANSGIKVDARYSTATKIVCFENDIRQVLNNLIANAIDAMRTGGRLMVRAHDCHVLGVPGVRITIADTGHGMSAAVQKRLFEPFFTTKDLNGTGLGLWISQGILERHQGRLRVRSGEGVGTVFTLFLPCEEVPVV